jgi:hypothetical protein
MFDMEYSNTHGIRERTLFAYRASDIYGEITPIIAQWLADNDHEILPYSPPQTLTPEEMRGQMPPISKRQLRLTLVRNGISLSDLDTAILAMGDEAVIEWQDASEYRRLHPLLNQVAAHLSLTQEQVDAMWQQALTA